jgi:hypothetical protein
MTTHALLDQHSADRLAKLCGMYGSDHAGERATAARKADELIRSAGLTWREIVTPPIIPDAPRIRAWARMAAFCHERRHQLSSWDRDFVRSMLNWHGEPSEKQQDCLASIFARLCSEAAA